MLYWPNPHNLNKNPRQPNIYWIRYCLHFSFNYLLSWNYSLTPFYTTNLESTNFSPILPSGGGGLLLADMKCMMANNSKNIQKFEILFHICGNRMSRSIILIWCQTAETGPHHQWHWWLFLEWRPALPMHWWVLIEYKYLTMITKGVRSFLTILYS